MAYIRFSTFVTLWTPQKFQARVADPMAQGAPASTFRTPGWARTCLIKIAKFSILYVVACTYNIDTGTAGIFVRLKCDGSPVFLGLPADPLEAPRGSADHRSKPPGLHHTACCFSHDPRPHAFCLAASVLHRHPCVWLIMCKYGVIHKPEVHNVSQRRKKRRTEPRRYM